MRSNKAQTGFSLVELMWALLGLAVLLPMIGSLFA